VIVLNFSCIFALENGLARTPPMGWNSWNWFACDFKGELKEKVLREIADAMVTTGMKDAGYTFVNMDDCWEGNRDANGYIQCNDGFPTGMKALTDYIHGKGLKVGIYSSEGDLTCQSYEGTYGHEDKDAEQYSNWGFDYLKLDWCNNHGNPQLNYSKMRDALKKVSRPIVFSICEWGSNQPWLWADTIGNVWRTTGDIAYNWNSIAGIIDKQVGLEKYSRPGAWNDPDMLEVGNGMSEAEDRAHFSMWCMLASPLITGNDLRNMSQRTIGIITNKEAIEVNQDSLGKQASRAKKDGTKEIWARDLTGKRKAVALLNRGSASTSIAFTWAEVGLNANDEYIVRDVWKHQDIDTLTTGFSATVGVHDVAMLVLTPPNIVAANEGRGGYRTWMKASLAATVEGNSVVAHYYGADRFHADVALPDGRVVAQRSGMGPAHNLFSGVALAPGMYIVKVRTSSRQCSARLILGE
jgi:alpha-galactosidase